MSLLAGIESDVGIKDTVALLATGQQQGTAACSTTARGGLVGTADGSASVGSFRSNWQALLASLESNLAAEPKTAGAQEALAANDALGLAGRIAVSARAAKAQSSLGTESLTSLIPESSGQTASQSNSPSSLASSAGRVSAKPESAPAFLANARLPLSTSGETPKAAFTIGDTTKHASGTARQHDSKDTVATPSSDAANATALASSVILPPTTQLTPPVEACADAGQPGATQLSQPGNLENATASTAAIVASVRSSILPSMGVQDATSRALPATGQTNDSSADRIQPATSAPPSQPLESSPSGAPIAVTPRADSSPVQTAYPAPGDTQNQNRAQDSAPFLASRQSASTEDRVLPASSGTLPTSAKAATANTTPQSAAATESKNVDSNLSTAADRTRATNPGDAPHPLAQPSSDSAQAPVTTGETISLNSEDGETASTSVAAAATSEAPSVPPVRTAERASAARLSSAIPSRNSRKAENISQDQSITPSFRSAVLDPARTPSTLPQVTTAPIPPAQTIAESVSNSASTPSTSSQGGSAFAALDSAARSDSAQWMHTGTQRAEAGFHDPALGWVGVRAEGARGQVHATVLPGSSDAAQVLGGHMAGLHAYLDGAHTSVQSVTLASPEGRESTFGGASDQGTGQGANQSMHQGDGQNPGQNPAPYSTREFLPTTLSSSIPSSPRNAPEVLAAPGQLTGPTTASGTHISVVA
jgi:hypothetical protein